MKKYYYVGVIANEVSNNDLKIVYDVDIVKNVAEWGTYEEIRAKKKQPKQFTKSTAEEIAKGLCAHMFLAFVIESFIELK